MKLINYISLGSVIEDYLDYSGHTGRIDKTFIKKVANDVVTKLTFPPQLTHVIKLLDVEKNRALIPENTFKIVQVAFKDLSTRKCRRTEIVEWIQRGYDSCDVSISFDCSTCGEKECTCSEPEIIFDVDRLWELGHPEFKYAHVDWMTRWGGPINDNVPCSPYHPAFYLVKPATHNFFNAEYHIKGSPNLNRSLLADSPIEYRIDMPHIYFNAEEGQALLSTLEYKTDEEGYRMIPNIPEVFDAIRWSIEAAMLYREHRRGRGTDKDKLAAHQYAKQQYMYHMRQAREKLRMLDFDTFWTYIENHHMKVNRYYDWRENMNRKKPDSYEQIMQRLTRK